MLGAVIHQRTKTKVLFSQSLYFGGGKQATPDKKANEYKICKVVINAKKKNKLGKETQSGCVG